MTNLRKVAYHIRDATSQTQLSPKERVDSGPAWFFVILFIFSAVAGYLIFEVMGKPHGGQIIQNRSIEGQVQ